MLVKGTQISLSGKCLKKMSCLLWDPNRAKTNNIDKKLIINTGNVIRMFFVCARYWSGVHQMTKMGPGISTNEVDGMHVEYIDQNTFLISAVILQIPVNDKFRCRYNGGYWVWRLLCMTRRLFRVTDSLWWESTRPWWNQSMIYHALLQLNL